MSSDAIVVSANSLSKCYQIYDKPHHRLLQMLLGRFGRQYFREFWALREVTFDIRRGRVIGILGKNGAGKSTLLQILCGTLASSSGTTKVDGRIAALLELGAGFNPEFTGIENVYMNGQILGLSRKSIEEKLPAIQAFADIGDFIHQPVKTYSSGMFARLAFAVSVHVDPDVLIVDEALSVGDSWFQHKSMAKMRELMSRGCTVLFVSHSIDSVRALCDEVIWLEDGRIKMHGDVTSVTNAYMNDVFIEHNRITLDAISSANIAHPENEAIEAEDTGDTIHRSSDNPIQSAAKQIDGSHVLEVLTTEVRNSEGLVTDHLEQGEAFSLEFKVHFFKSLKNISLGFLIKDQFGQDLTGESVFNTYRHSLDFTAGQTVCFSFSSTMLLRGGQSYSVALRINQVSRWDRSDNVVVFANELATVFNVLADQENPMWFKFRQPFSVCIKQ